MPSTKNSDSKFVKTSDIYKGNVFLVFILDGKVVETFICNEKMAAILQSNPTIVEITEGDPFLTGPHKGWNYNGEYFSIPDVD